MATTTTTLIVFCIFLSPLALSVLGFDYFKFVQQWPPSFCNNPGSYCAIVPRDFTIHGLWPDNFVGPSPSYCRGSQFTNIQGIAYLGRMAVSWPNLKYPSSQSFWEEQWKKHGTCSEYVFNQHDYFVFALDYKDMYNLRQILQQSSINPGSGYPAAQVNSSIYGFTGNIPDLRCTNSNSGVLQLTEIILCVGWGGVIIDCPRPNMACFQSPIIDYPA